MIWSTGTKNPTAVFIVGIYIDKEFLSKGSGETVEIAEEMAAREAIKNYLGTNESSAPIPYGAKAKKYNSIIYEKFQKSLLNISK